MLQSCLDIRRRKLPVVGLFVPLVVLLLTFLHYIIERVSLRYHRGISLQVSCGTSKVRVVLLDMRVQYLDTILDLEDPFTGILYLLGVLFQYVLSGVTSVNLTIYDLVSDHQPLYLKVRVLYSHYRRSVPLVPFGKGIPFYPRLEYISHIVPIDCRVDFELCHHLLPKLVQGTILEVLLHGRYLRKLSGILVHKGYLLFHISFKSVSPLFPVGSTKELLLYLKDAVK